MVDTVSMISHPIAEDRGRVDGWLLACACGHPYGQHDGNGGPCGDYWAVAGDLVPCGCPAFAATGESLDAELSVPSPAAKKRHEQEELARRRAREDQAIRQGKNPPALKEQA